MLRVDEAPTQITAGVDKAEVGAVDNGLTVIVVLTHVVVLHVPSALAKYVVVTAGFLTGLAPEIE